MKTVIKKFSAMFAPSTGIAGGPQSRRPCKDPRVNTKVLKKIYMNSELSKHVAKKHKFEPENFKNLTHVARQKFWVSTRGRKKDIAEGAAKSLNTGLSSSPVVTVDWTVIGASILRWVSEIWTTAVVIVSVNDTPRLAIRSFVGIDILSWRRRSAGSRSRSRCY